MRIGVLLLSVRDFPLMLRFYRDTMDLAVSTVDPGAGYRPLEDFVQFKLEGPTTLELFAESRKPSTAGYPLPRQNAVCIAFRVDDIQAVYTQLVERGVEFSQPVGEEDWGYYADFKDPEGNRLQIYEPHPGYE